MARSTRARTQARPEIRNALVAHRKHLFDAFATRESDEVTRQIERGAPVEIDADMMFTILHRIDPRAADAFTYKHRAANAGRRWLLDERDVLTEIRDRDGRSDASS